jgi:uncharacterized protein
MDLRSKLEMYKSGQKETVPVIKDKGKDLHDFLEGTVATNDQGSCFIVEKRYPITHLHGGYQLNRALHLREDILRKLCPGIKAGMGIGDMLFLDTETTGLSGGAGTVAFLIGIGFFDGDSFILRQYLMRDYDEEPSMLESLNGVLARYKGLVTFNGKAFDWNLIQTRHTFNRMRPLLKDPVHIDLLFPARKLWKLKLESCRLASLEENILGEVRVDDIPGAMIPSIYFKYLEDRDTGQLVKVIRHNELDILSMASLLTRITEMLENPSLHTDGAHELLGVGSIYESSGEEKGMLECYEQCLQSEILLVKEKAARKLIGLYKRSRSYDKAVEHCIGVLPPKEGRTLVHIPMMIELAMLYEHRVKNLPQALEIVENALAVNLQYGYKNSIYSDDLKKRWERLKRKQEKNNVDSTI